MEGHLKLRIQSLLISCFSSPDSTSPTPLTAARRRDSRIKSDSEATCTCTVSALHYFFDLFYF